MPYDRFMIAPMQMGLETDLRPFMIPDQAFARLNNAYLFRGRIRKRFGSFLTGSDPNDPQLSRLRIMVGTTDGSGDLAGIVPGASGAIGQMFSISTQLFTVVSAGFASMNWTGSALIASFDTATGAFNIVSSDFPNTAVYWYPALPVMGITNFESTEISNQPTFAFDTRFAYRFNNGAWERLGTAQWSGDNADFFWSDTWHGNATSENILFTTNYNAADNIKYWDGATWTNFTPLYDSTETIVSARIVVNFKNRLLLFNTIETVAASNTHFYSRCRYSQNGSPIDANAFRQDIPGRGGYIDASTQEKIITVEFLKDRLIVFFERSTWELVYSANEAYPFYWQKINTELGAESTFSIVPFDKVIIGIGNIGIHACNGANVERIDEEIPQAVFEIHNDNNGVERVAGIRDYNVEMVYWSFPSETQSTDYPYNNRVLVFNYVTKSWSFNDDSITAFGYFNNANPGVTWAQMTSTWEESLMTWGSGQNQSKFRQVIAGNQQGFMFIVAANTARNAAALSITNMTVADQIITITVIDHNMKDGGFIVIENAQGMTGVNGIIYEIQDIIDANTLLVVGLTATGTYTGGGTIARVSQIDILTKMYNFYADKGRNCYIAKTDFLVDRTSGGQITVDYYPSYSQLSMVTQGAATGALLGNGILHTSPYALIPLENEQNQLWHPMYPQTDAETVQLRLFLDREQMLDTTVWQSDFQLHAMTFYTTPTSSRLQ